MIEGHENEKVHGIAIGKLYWLCYLFGLVESQYPLLSKVEENY